MLPKIVWDFFFPARLCGLVCLMAAVSSAIEMVVSEIVGVAGSTGSSGSPIAAPAGAHCTDDRCCAYTSALVQCVSGYCLECKCNTFLGKGLVKSLSGPQSPESNYWSSHTRLFALTALRIYFDRSLARARSPSARAAPRCRIRSSVCSLIHGLRGL